MGLTFHSSQQDRLPWNSRDGKDPLLPPAWQPQEIVQEIPEVQIVEKLVEASQSTEKTGVQRGKTGVSGEGRVDCAASKLGTPGTNLGSPSRRLSGVHEKNLLYKRSRVVHDHPEVGRRRQIALLVTRLGAIALGRGIWDRTPTELHSSPSATYSSSSSSSSSLSDDRSLV